MLYMSKRNHFLTPTIFVRLNLQTAQLKATDILCRGPLMGKKVPNSGRQEFHNQPEDLPAKHSAFLSKCFEILLQLSKKKWMAAPGPHPPLQRTSRRLSFIWACPTPTPIPQSEWPETEWGKPDVPDKWNEGGGKTHLVENVRGGPQLFEGKCNLIGNLLSQIIMLFRKLYNTVKQITKKPIQINSIGKEMYSRYRLLFVVWVVNPFCLYVVIENGLLKESCTVSVVFYMWIMEERRTQDS